MMKIFDFSEFVFSMDCTHHFVAVSFTLVLEP